MKVIIICFFCLWWAKSWGQTVISGNSDSRSVHFVPEYVFTQPPKLSVVLQLEDANLDGLIEAGESFVLKAVVRNNGRGSAFGLTFTRLKGVGDEEIEGDSTVFLSELPAKMEKTMVMSLNVCKQATAKQVVLKFKISEHFGFDTDTCELRFSFVEHIPSELVCAGMEIVDHKSKGMYASDGILQVGELAGIRLRLMNMGGSLYDCRGVVRSNDKNVWISDTLAVIGNLPLGECATVEYNICSNNRFQRDSVALTLYLYEEDHLFQVLKVSIPVNHKPVSKSVLTIRPEIEQMIALKKQSEKKQSEMDKVLQVPLSKSVRRNALAVVIGVENYLYLPSAPYASKDAQLMTGYFKRTMGIKNVLTYYNSAVRGDFFEELFGENGQLSSLVKAGETDVFIYYSGHGIPEKDGKEAYLFPYDGRLASANECGYSLNRFYTALDQLNAASVTVFLDACFVGVTKASSFHTSRNISGTKGVLVRPPNVQPWLTNPNFTVFTSSQHNEASLAFDDSETGLFTYYLALGLHGEADVDGDRCITIGELSEYVHRKVTEISFKIRGEQTPQLNGNRKVVLVEY